MSEATEPSRNGAHTEENLLYADVVIVGLGPAGASLACFLASHGIKGVMVGMNSTTADTPRAHITNMAALECLRDIGLEEECLKLAAKGDCMLHTLWCHSMAGREYARICSWGSDPQRKGDYDTASPCSPIDLPQTLLEPLLIQYATRHGFQCRFDTEFVSFQDDGSKVITSFRDKLTNSIYRIQSKYLFGADGARSKVLQQLDLPLLKKPSQGLAINVLVKADLSHLMKHRMGNLHWIMQPDIEHPTFAWIGIARMVKPWKEWIFIFLPSLSSGTSFSPSRAECLQRVHQFIGDDTPAEILDVSKWHINEIVAQYYSKGNVFCLGDAVHRHPPMNGLGSNTCIQDAFNLAWKISFVMKGIAGASLLESYSQERQPVGEDVITRANEGFRDHYHVWDALGILAPTASQRMQIFKELEEASEQGARRRAAFQRAIKHTAHEFHGLGIEMNQMYVSAAVFAGDEEAPFVDFEEGYDKVLDHTRSTYPGRRLPHVWLNTAIPSEPISTIDLAGKGSFVLLTGIGGKKWKEAAESISTKLGLAIQAFLIGFGQDYEDPYFEWNKLRGVGETGCVLVRPDRFIAWRCQKMIENDGGPEKKLMEVLCSVLCK